MIGKALALGLALLSYPLGITHGKAERPIRGTFFTGVVGANVNPCLHHHLEAMPDAENVAPRHHEIKRDVVSLGWIEERGVVIPAVALVGFKVNLPEKRYIGCFEPTGDNRLHAGRLHRGERHNSGRE